jgi:hypothetical protein
VAVPPSGAHDQIFITIGHLRSSCCGASSLMRGWVCNLLVQSAVTLRSKSHRTHDHIFLSHLRLLGPLFVTSYDSQGYGGGILTCPHMSLTSDCLVQLGTAQSNVTTDGQSVNMSWCQAPSGSHDHLFVTVWKWLWCLCGVPSLTRGRVCRFSVRVCNI